MYDIPSYLFVPLFLTCVLNRIFHAKRFTFIWFFIRFHYVRFYKLREKKKQNKEKIAFTLISFEARVKVILVNVIWYLEKSKKKCL